MPEAKTILITGASSGIGQACAKQFAAAGHRIIICARRIEKLEALSQALQTQYGTEVLPLFMDVQDQSGVQKAIDTLDTPWKNIDILVNNAGLALSSETIDQGKISNWDTMIKTNINGLLYVTHAILPGMLARNSGQIINIGSIAGHEAYTGGNVYSATKHAVKAISKSMRIDLMGKNIRVCEVSPGMVKTEFSLVRWKDQEKSDQFYAQIQPLKPEDIADAVCYCAHAPNRVTIEEMIVMPSCQASANHVAKSGEKAKSVFD